MPYLYPDTDVLRNKENIRDEDELEKFEGTHSADRLLTLPHNLPITADGYREIHRYIFQDVYEWAGQDRTIDLCSGSILCSRPGFIDRDLDKCFEAINAEDDLRGLTADQFAARAAEHISELNAIHPFREGNGRTMRAFLGVLAEQAGHEIDLARIDPQAWNVASIEGFCIDDYGPMRDVIAGAIVDDREHEHEAERQPREQEQGSSHAPATPTTAEKDAKDLDAQATEGELTDDKQARLNRLLNTLDHEDAMTREIGEDHSLGGPGGGRTLE
jgi:fido (protein-threonine AMPylation protein)